MNRRLRWSQTPPNISDYDADCVKAPVFAPFQQTPRPADDCKAEKTGPDQGKGSSKGGGKGVVKPSKKESPKQQQEGTMDSGGFQPKPNFCHS